MNHVLDNGANNILCLNQLVPTQTGVLFGTAPERAVICCNPGQDIFYPLIKK